MKNLSKLFIAGVVALSISASLIALPPGPGSQHIRFNGTETFTAIAPDFSTFTSLHTISAPSLQLEDYVLILEAQNRVMEWLGDGFYMAGAGDILASDGVTVMGLATYVARTHVLEFTEEQPWEVNCSLTGVIWSGPLAGLVLSENIHGGGTTVPWYYQAIIDGFFTVPEFVDVNLLKASLAD